MFETTNHIYIYIISLVGGWPTPLKKYEWKSVGMNEIPNIWKHKFHVPKHQAVYMKNIEEELTPDNQTWLAGTSPT